MPKKKELKKALDLAIDELRNMSTLEEVGCEDCRRENIFKRLANKTLEDIEEIIGDGKTD